VNQRKPGELPKDIQQQQQAAGPSDADFFDPTLVSGASKRLQRQRRGFDFVEVRAWAWV
jgi:hypothetical protein